MVLRLRVMITRIQTMRTSTMVATFIMIGLLLIYHIKQADYEMRVEKMANERIEQDADDVVMDIRNAKNESTTTTTPDSTVSNLDDDDQDDVKHYDERGESDDDNVDDDDYDPDYGDDDDDDDVVGDDDGDVYGDNDERKEDSTEKINNETLAEEVAKVNNELEERFHNIEGKADFDSDGFNDNETNSEREDIDEGENDDIDNEHDDDDNGDNYNVGGDDDYDEGDDENVGDNGDYDNDDDDDDQAGDDDDYDEEDDDNGDYDDDDENVGDNGEYVDGDDDDEMTLTNKDRVINNVNDLVDELEITENKEEENVNVDQINNEQNGIMPSRSLQFFKDGRKFNHKEDFNLANEQVQKLAEKYPDTLNDIGIKIQNDLYVERLRYKLYQTGRLDVVDWNHCTKRLPTSIIIGVMKTGTEAFSTFLGLHPQVAMQFGYTGMEFFSNPELYKLGLEWYRERMTCSHRGQVTMEKSPQYFSSAMAPSRIYNMDKDIKLILLVRDPISRAVSHFLQQQNSHPERLPASTFEDCVYDRNRKQIIGTSQYVYQSTYSVIYQRWRKYFPAKNILIVDGDKFKKNPLHGLAKTEMFLGLNHMLDESKLEYNVEKGFYCIRTDPNNPVDMDTSCLNGGKGRPHPEIDPEVELALRRYLKPYNDEFMRLTGMQFDW